MGRGDLVWFVVVAHQIRSYGEIELDGECDRDRRLSRNNVGLPRPSLRSSNGHEQTEKPSKILCGIVLQ